MNEWLYVLLFMVVGAIIPIGAIAAGVYFWTQETESC